MIHYNTLYVTSLVLLLIHFTCIAASLSSQGSIALTYEIDVDVPLDKAPDCFMENIMSSFTCLVLHLR